MEKTVMEVHLQKGSAQAKWIESSTPSSKLCSKARLQLLKKISYIGVYSKDVYDQRTKETWPTLFS